MSFKQGLFNMTTDSHLFRTAKALDAEGYYRIDGNRWRKGEAVYLPLYQGRMIQQFDHRANSIRLNPDSSHNPYLSEEVTPEQHKTQVLPRSPNTGSRKPWLRRSSLSHQVMRWHSGT